MFFEQSRKSKIDEDIQRQKKELSIIADNLKINRRQTEELFEKIGVSPEDMDSYFQDKESFSPQMWDFFQEVKEKYLAQLEKDLAYTTPQEKKSRFSDFRRRMEGIR